MKSTNRRRYARGQGRGTGSGQIVMTAANLFDVQDLLCYHPPQPVNFSQTCRCDKDTTTIIVNKIDGEFRF